MKIRGIKTLTLDNQPLGLRFYTDEGIFDADRESLFANKVFSLSLPEQLALVPREDLLVTSEDENYPVTDISKDNESLFALLLEARSHPEYFCLFTFLQPYEQSLSAFLADSSWLFLCDKEEASWCKYRVVRPDGEVFSGKWYNLHSSVEEAKMAFHYAQTKEALYSGLEVKAEAIKGYEDLEYVLDSILAVQSLISVKSTDYFEMQLGARVKKVSLDSFPFLRSAQREFIIRHRLVSKGLNRGLSEDSIFTPADLVIIALKRALREFESQSSSPSPN